MRLESIKRANQLLYEQTDNMKILRSQELYSDVLYERTDQINVKERLKLTEKEREAAYHEDLLAQIQADEALERLKADELKRKLTAVHHIREEQLVEAKIKRKKEAAEQRALGEALIRQCHIQLDEDVASQNEMREKNKQSNQEMLTANHRLQLIKNELHEKELAENERREMDIMLSEQRKIAHKALEQRRFEKQQLRRQQLIDAAVLNLTERQKQDQARFEKEEGEMKVKKEKEDKHKEDTKARLWNDVVASRTSQLEDKKTRERREKQEQEQLFHLMKEQVDLEERLEREKDAQSKDMIKSIKALQLSEAIELQRKKVEEKLTELEQDRILRDISDQDDRKFRELVLQEIDRYAAMGKPTYTLYRALEHKPPDLLAAQRNSRKKEGEEKK